MKKRSVIIVAVLAVYALLLLLLQYFEAAAPDSGITDFGDALWYSLVTVTTVGYGDLYPVTMGGRIVGFIFLMISTGLLATALSFAAALIFGQMFPRLRLWLWLGHPFYIFNSHCDEAYILAKQLLMEDSRPVCIFVYDGSQPFKLSGRTIFFWGSMEEALHRGKSIAGVFIFGKDSYKNLSQARALIRQGVSVYCESVLRPDDRNGALTVFDRCENTARLYWRQHPLNSCREKIVLIGMGEYGQRLLEQGLLVNVTDRQQEIEYHIFGDSGEFQRRHTHLSDMLCVGQKGQGDCIFFHSEPWNNDAALLMSAARIILCTDDDSTNMSILDTILRFYPIKGRVHVRLLHGIELEAGGAEAFGGCGELFSPELVMRRELNALAMEMNDLYRCRSGSTAPEWDELSPFARRSSMAAADHLLTKIRLLLPDEDIRAVTGGACAKAYAAYKASLPEDAEKYRYIEHERWMRFHYLNNWEFDAVRDDAKRLHPLLCPFDELPPDEQRKDDDPWELLAALAAEREAQIR